MLTARSFSCLKIVLDIKLIIASSHKLLYILPFNISAHYLSITCMRCPSSGSCAKAAAYSWNVMANIYEQPSSLSSC